MAYIEVDDSNKWNPTLLLRLRVRDKNNVIIVEINGKDYLFDKNDRKKDFEHYGDVLAFIEERYTPGT